MRLNAFSLRTRSHTDDLLKVSRKLNYLVSTLKPRKNYSYRTGDKAQVTFLMKHVREQRVVVKTSYSRNTVGRSWAAHGKYLQREHAQNEQERGLGFNADSQSVDLQKKLYQWQRAGDERFFKIILSPENADKLDLQQHVRELMQQAEKDMGTKLQWIAIDHYNTDHPHAHILIRGRDQEGKGLTIDPTYIAEGFRHRSQEIATLKLGLRTENDISLARSRQIEKNYLTELDRSIRLRAVDDIVNFETKIPLSKLAKERRIQEIKRLKFLETLNLAQQIGQKIWRISPDLEQTLKSLQLSNDIIKSRAQHGLSPHEYSESLKNTEISAPITGKIVGINFKENSPVQSSITFDLHSKMLTDWDRSLQLKAKHHIVSFDNAIPYGLLERKRRLQEIARLKFLESLGLAKKVDAKKWQLSETFTQDIYNLGREHIKKQPLDLVPGGFKPFVVTNEASLTGRVAGVGLENALHDRRYLLIEDISGKVHYVRATESIIKARDQFKFKNNDIITLNTKTFNTPENETISYIDVKNHQAIENVLLQKVSILDEEIVSYVKNHGKVPDIDENSSTFSQTFIKEMKIRFAELSEKGLFIFDNDKIVLANACEQRLDDIQHSRYGEFECWAPHLNKSQENLTLTGTVVASNSRCLLLEDIRGKYYQIQNNALGIDSPFKIGSGFYLRRHTIPKLEFTKTDERLENQFSLQGYSPKVYTQELMKALQYQKNFFLKNEADIDKFVLAHQWRCDTWVKWGFVSLEEGIYKLTPDKMQKLATEKIELHAAMKNHLQALKQEYELAVQKRPCLFTLLNKKSLKLEPKKFVLLDRILKETGKPLEKSQAQVTEYLRKRTELWQSRGIKIDDQFEKNARRWFIESQTLEQVQKRSKKPLSIVQAKTHTQFKGKIFAMGSLDKLGISYLLLETNNALLAFAMKEKQLLKYKLNQTISLSYSYQKDHKLSLHKSIDKEISYG